MYLFFLLIFIIFLKATKILSLLNLEEDLNKT